MILVSHMHVYGYLPALGNFDLLADGRGNLLPLSDTGNRLWKEKGDLEVGCVLDF